MDVPDSLTRKIELFRHSAIIERYRDGLFPPTSWLSVFIGQGLIPENYSPLADTMQGESLVAHMDAFRVDLLDRVEEMRRHERFIDLYCAAEPAVTPMGTEVRL